MQKAAASDRALRRARISWEQSQEDLRIAKSRIRDSPEVSCLQSTQAAINALGSVLEAQGHFQLPAFSSVEMIITPPGPDENADHFDTYQNYEIECEQREKLMAFLYEKNIGTIIQWGGKAIHQIEALNFNSELPYTNEIFKKCLLLPMNTTLTDEAVEYIISVIQEFYIQS